MSNRSRAKRRKNPGKADRLGTAKSSYNTSPVRGALRQPLLRERSKLSSLIAILRRPKGATIDQMIVATGWQAHSVRGAISGALKKKRGFTVNSAIEGGGARVYRIVG